MKKILTKDKIERKYKQKLSSRMNSIDRKYDRQLATIEERKEREKQTWTKRLMEMMRKELIAEKTGKEVTKTSYQKIRADTTAYADACYGVQLLARLRDTDNYWYGRCITCSNQYEWRELDGGHCISKWTSRACALDYRNVNAQCKDICNSKFTGNGRYDIYKIRVDEKRWAGTHDDLLRIKNTRKQTKPEQRLRENIDTIEMMLSAKVFDTTSYWKRCKKIRKKYCPDN